MFRIGTSSYILPDEILPNVRYLAPQVDDVELVLFETDEYGSNLPDESLRCHLKALATAHDLTYTVHLPLDLRFGSEGEPFSMSLRKADRAIAATSDLDPFAYVVHLDGRDLLDGKGDGQDLLRWQAQAARALEIVCRWLPEPDRLSIENLERWDPEAFAPIVDSMPVSRTIDVGHLWLEGVDPLAHIRRWIGRTRVVHMHGIAARDHAALTHVPPEKLDPVVAFLADHFSGVVTLEVFNEADFHSSLAALRESLERTEAGDQHD